MQGMVVKFTYRDRNGDKTLRVVEVSDVYADSAAGPVYFDGYCRTRKAMRTFRVDRVIGNVVDVNSGDVVRMRTSEPSAPESPVALAIGGALLVAAVIWVLVQVLR
jgi:hypothetical protein